MPPPAAGSAGPVDGTDLLLAAGATSLVVAGGCLLLGKRRRRRALVRWILLATIGGMAVYILYARELIRPDAWGILPEGAWAARAAMVGMVALGAVLPLTAVVRTTDAQNEQGS
jgi:LPXTG-motif cell wall-anchored protein